MISDALPTEGIIKGTMILTVGTFVVQALTALSQLVLAVWLSPQEFGSWAAATAALAIITGLVNFGETSGYLSAPNALLRDSEAAALRYNWKLTVVGVAIGVVYLVTHKTFVGVLIICSAVQLPLLGEANLLYVAYVKSRRRRRLVLTQAFAAIARLAVGLTAAWVTESAFAFVFASMTYSVVMIIVLRPALTTGRPSSTLSISPARGQRLSWAAQSSAQMLAGQADYLIISWIASPALLGLYFFAYQATVGVSAVLSAPLSRTALSELAKARVEQRNKLATLLCNYAVAAVSLVVAFSTIMIMVAHPLLPSAWQGVEVGLVILLGSLPARFMNPLTDALQMSHGQWWKSTRFNLIDAAGTGAASISALTGDLTTMALAVGAWKVVFGGVRFALALPSGERKRAAQPCLWSVVVFLGLAISAQSGSQTVTVLISSCISLTGAFAIWRLTAGLRPRERIRARGAK